MLKKNTGYMLSEPFRRVQADVEAYLKRLKTDATT
jgi:hypothetical protein